MAFFKNLFKKKQKTADQKIDESIGDEMKKSCETNKRLVRILLLGAGGSGKSTLLKQLEIIYGEPFTKKKQHEALASIRANILKDIYDLCHFYFILKDAATSAGDKALRFFHDKYRLPLETEKLCNEIEVEINFGQKNKNGVLLKKSFLSRWDILWQTNQMKNLFKARKQSQIMDNTEFFFSKIQEYSHQDYKASFDEYVRIREVTSGITSKNLNVKIEEEGKSPLKFSGVFNVTDVGGQRSERSKWVKLFSGVDFVLYIMSLSSYDQVLFEDNTQNCWVETMNVFSSVVNNPTFFTTDFILFFNKDDIFTKKIKHTPFDLHTLRDKDREENKWTKEEKNDEKKVKEWIKKQFEDMWDESQHTDGRRRNRCLFTHVTCATDTQQVSVVVKAIQVHMVKQLMAKSSLF